MDFSQGPRAGMPQFRSPRRRQWREGGGRKVDRETEAAQRGDGWHCAGPGGSVCRGRSTGRGLDFTFRIRGTSVFRHELRVMSRGKIEFGVFGIIVAAAIIILVAQ